MARTNSDRAFSPLHHVIDMEWMQEAYRQTPQGRGGRHRRRHSAGYEANQEVNLRDLIDRIRSGRYVAPPVRRAYIPKADGSHGIGTTSLAETKVPSMLAGTTILTLNKMCQEKPGTVPYAVCLGYLRGLFDGMQQAKVVEQKIRFVRQLPPIWIK